MGETNVVSYEEAKKSTQESPEFTLDISGYDDSINNNIEFSIDKDRKYSNEYSMSFFNMAQFSVTSYLFNLMVDDHCGDYMEISETQKMSFEYDFEKTRNIIFRGEIVFSYKEKIIYTHFDAQSRMIKLKSNDNKKIKEIVENLEYNSKVNNPYRLKSIELTHNGNINIKRRPSVTLDDVILPSSMKEDIYDNTIFTLKELKESNGIIFHGDPGTGKSMTCSALINEAINEGLNACYITSEMDYEWLNVFLESFMYPCIVIFEDIDSYAESRDNVMNKNLSNFLQFINGITERKNNVVFIATTNHVDRLDKAVANRPVRFNRRFEFTYPGKELIKKLISQYFDDDIANDKYELCVNQNFTGAHIREIKRTAKLLSTKNKTSLYKEFDEAVSRVKDNFATKKKHLGF